MTTIDFSKGERIRNVVPLPSTRAPRPVENLFTYQPPEYVCTAPGGRGFWVVDKDEIQKEIDNYKALGIEIAVYKLEQVSEVEN
jgi:hypothetical protein